MRFIKSILFTSLVSFGITAIGFAQQPADSLSNNDRDKFEKIQLFRKNFKDSLPGPVGYVNDYENLFTNTQEYILDSLIRDYEKQTSIEIAIVSFDTIMTAKNDFEKLTLKILNKWGVGKKEKNNGILIGICRGYRIMRVENGYGIEKILSNDDTKKIIDDAFTPYFKEGKYFEGTLNGLKAIMNRLR